MTTTYRKNQKTPEEVAELITKCKEALPRYPWNASFTQDIVEQLEHISKAGRLSECSLYHTIKVLAKQNIFVHQQLIAMVIWNEVVHEGSGFPQNLLSLFEKTAEEEGKSDAARDQVRVIVEALKDPVKAEMFQEYLEIREPSPKRQRTQPSNEAQVPVIDLSNDPLIVGDAQTPEQREFYKLKTAQASTPSQCPPEMSAPLSKPLQTPLLQSDKPPEGLSVAQQREFYKLKRARSSTPSQTPVPEMSAPLSKPLQTPLLQSDKPPEGLSVAQQREFYKLKRARASTPSQTLVPEMSAPLSKPLQTPLLQSDKPPEGLSVAQQREFYKLKRARASTPSQTPVPEMSASLSKPLQTPLPPPQVQQRVEPATRSACNVESTTKSSNVDYDKIETYIKDRVKFFMESKEASQCTLVAPEVLYDIPGSAHQETSEYIMVGPEVQHEAVGITTDDWRCMLEAIRFKPTPLEHLRNGGVIDVVMERKDINWVETHALLTREPILPTSRNPGHLKVKVGACKAREDPADAPLRWVVAAPTQGRIEFFLSRLNIAGDIVPWTKTNSPPLVGVHAGEIKVLWNFHGWTERRLKAFCGLAMMEPHLTVAQIQSDSACFTWDESGSRRLEACETFPVHIRRGALLNEASENYCSLRRVLPWIEGEDGIVGFRTTKLPDIDHPLWFEEPWKLDI